MRSGILTVVILTAGAAALADPPPPASREVVNDLNELRQQFSPSNSTPAEFAQAVQNLAERGQETHNPFADLLDSTTQAVQAWAADGAPQPAPQPAHNPWARFGRTPPNRPAPAPGGGPPHPPVPHEPPVPPAPPGLHGPPSPPHHAPPEARPPKALLEDTAFDLERMAHELEKADLYSEADALRETAGRLRKSARQQKNPAAPRSSWPPLAAPAPPPAPAAGPAPAEPPQAVEWARRAMLEANGRIKRLERQLAEGEARFKRQVVAMAQLMEDMQRMERRHQEREKPEGREKPQERRGRRGRPDRPEVEADPLEVNPAVPHPSYDLISPPAPGNADAPPAGDGAEPSDPQN